MENAVIKMVDEHYESASDMEKVIMYIAGRGKNAGKEKLLKCRGRGVSSKAAKVPGQMAAVQKAFGKAEKRRMYHMVVSFPEDMRDAKQYKRPQIKYLICCLRIIRFFMGYIFPRITGISIMPSMQSAIRLAKNGIRVRRSLRG